MAPATALAMLRPTALVLARGAIGRCRAKQARPVEALGVRGRGLRQTRPVPDGVVQSGHIRLRGGRRTTQPLQAAAGVGEEDTAVSDALRALPLAAGVFGIVATLGNRIFSGIAPVVDASSSQSRADVLAIGLSAVLILTGLQWLSVKPKTPVAVELNGTPYDYIAAGLPEGASSELLWAYESLSEASNVKAMVVMYGGRCVFHKGAGKAGATPGQAEPGEMCQQVMRSGRGNYVANLTPYPGRFEFFGFLPSKTQSIILQPLGNQGVLVVASDTPRSFTSIDQAWISTLAEKIEVTLSEDATTSSSPSA
eukprot:jgi/Tetstr1/432933/TSEL_022273.t1